MTTKTDLDQTFIALDRSVRRLTVVSQIITAIWVTTPLTLTLVGIVLMAIWLTS
jgi:hypothetical protein